MLALPVRVRQFPNFLHALWRRHRVLRRDEETPRKLFLCYFCCESYFRYLYCSVHSLVRCGAGHAIEVIVFNDCEEPLTLTQIEALSALTGGVRVLDWSKSMGWGGEQIRRIWDAYGIVAAWASEDDYIARVDADVFFFNDRIFRVVKRSNADLIGDGHFVDFRYTQGGCYFFRAGAVRKINTMLRAEVLERVLEEVDMVVEDVAATHFARRLGLDVWLTWFMMFPDELRIAGGLTRWMRWKFSCVHFVMKNKEAMLETYEREQLDRAERESFRGVLETR